MFLVRLGKDENVLFKCDEAFIREKSNVKTDNIFLGIQSAEKILMWTDIGHAQIGCGHVCQGFKIMDHVTAQAQR